MTTPGHEDTHVEHAHAPEHGEYVPPTGWHRWTYPGWLRVLWCTPLGGGIGLGLVLLLRWAASWHPVWKGVQITTVELTTIPLGFLVGLGGFDYWARYCSGKPTVPEDHSRHGARSWRDYFRINTDHKVIGVQYVVTTMTFFVIGGFLALLFRAELAKPGTQYFNPQTFNSLITDHATLMIFLVIIPAF